MRKSKKLKERLNQIEEILNGTDELSDEERKMLNTTIATIFNLHIRSSEDSKKVG